MKIFKKAKVFITLLVSALLITGGAVSVFAATATTQENTPYDGMDFFTIDGAPGYCAERKKGVPINENYTIQATDKDGYAASSNGRDEKDWWRDDANHWDDVKHILYVGYPADKAGLGSGVDASTFRAATQEAVWYFTNSLPLSDNEAGRLAQKIIDDTTSVPSSATLNFWVADNKNANQSIFTLTVDDAPEPLIKNTTARVNDTAGSIELAAGEEGTFTDVIEIENFGEDYTVECTLYKDGAVFATAAVKADQAEVTVTFDQKITEAGEYSVSSLLKKGDEVVGGTHNAALDIASETVTVTVKEKEEEGDTTPDEFTIKISKKELGGAEIPGAEMTLTDAEGNEVEAWTSGDSTHEVKLAAGTYVLEEKAAPKGYKQVTTKMEFEVSEEGEVKLVTTKVDAGGKLSLADSDHIVLEDAVEGESEEPSEEGKENPEEKNKDSEEKPSNEEPGKDDDTQKTETKKETPKSPAKSPKTGDESNPVPWFAILGLACAAFAGIRAYGRRK